MAIDRSALENIHPDSQPVLRFFQWSSPMISFGYLMNLEKVSEWAKTNGHLPVVKRPTGGGAVIHQTNDLSLSLLWPRHQGIFPDKPRDCYEEIHSLMKNALQSSHSPLGGESFSGGLYLQQKCDQNPPQTPPKGETDGRFSICYSEPVCNDVMQGGRKVIGGALRLTREAILYQGNIQIGPDQDNQRLRRAILSAFSLAFSSSHLSKTS